VTDFSLAPLVQQTSRYLLRHPSRFTEVKELLELRDGLELHAVSLAANRMDQSCIDGMKDVLEKTDAKIRSGQSPVDESSEFHIAMYRGTRNGVLIRLASAITRLLLELQRSWFTSDGSGSLVRRDYEDHLAIYRALRDGRAADATEIMKGHLTHTKEVLEMLERRQGASEPDTGTGSHLATNDRLEKNL
jgi:DNA-binding FadR family transcriptional regulator